MAVNLGLITINGVLAISCDTNPSTSGGLFAPIGSIAFAKDGTGFYYKSGATDTDWSATSGATGSAGGELSGTYPNPSVLNSAVIQKVLTGLNITGSSISASDNLLTAFGKLQNQINGLLGGAIYQGTYNATTNTPTLIDGTGTKGYYYVVNVGGIQNFGSGAIDFAVGDWVIYNGSIWQKVDNTDAVTSVNGFIGAVNLTTANISEVTNLYFTAARVLATQLTGYVSGAGTITASDTVLQAIQKLNGNISAITGITPITGTAVLNFDTEQNIATTTINVSANPLVSLVTNSNIKNVSFINTETTSTSLDDFVLNGVTFGIQNIVDNTSFDIVGSAVNNASGNYTIKYFITI